MIKDPIYIKIALLKSQLICIDDTIKKTKDELMLKRLKYIYTEKDNQYEQLRDQDRANDIAYIRSHPKSFISIEFLMNFMMNDRYSTGDPVCISQFFEYNSQNRLISKAYSEYIETYEYNNSGRLVAIILHSKSARDGYEWEQKTELQYSKGRIYKGIIF